jgi:hypothetical protein
VNRIAIVACATFALATFAAASGSFAGPGGGQTIMGLPLTDQTFHGGQSQQNTRQPPPKVQAILELREEGLRLQQADGGTLTDAHRAYLQQKLDAIRAQHSSTADFSRGHCPRPEAGMSCGSW